MTLVYCVRHGQSISEARGVTMEQAAIPLSALGAAQAEALAERLEIEPSRILTSSYVRATQTAAPLCSRWQRQAEVHPLLHEFCALDAARLQGTTGVELADAYWEAADPEIRMGPEAESFLEFIDRIDAFTPELTSLPDRSVLVGHGTWFGMLFWRLMGFAVRSPAGMRAFRRFTSGLPMPNCAVYELKGPRDGRWNVRADEALSKAIAQVSGRDTC